MVSCNSDDCVYSKEIAELKRDSERNSEQHREFYKNFNDIDKKQAIVEERYNNLLAVTSETRTIVTELKEKPAKKWDDLSWLIVSTIVAGIVGYIIGMM